LFGILEKLEIVQSEKVASVGGWKGGLGGIPPALQILGEISSNFFESTPPSLKVQPRRYTAPLFYVIGKRIAVYL